jgi:hypothetical protein
MIQCVSDHTPYDNEPDPIEEAERWLKRHPEDAPSHSCDVGWARAVIECLLEFVEENV